MLTIGRFTVYNTIFPPFALFKTVDELLMRYDDLIRADANPYTIGGLLLWLGIAVLNAPPELLQKRSDSVKDAMRFVRRVSETVEEVVVTNDSVAGSVEGVEISLLWVRL